MNCRKHSPALSPNILSRPNRITNRAGLMKANLPVIRNLRHLAKGINHSQDQPPLLAKGRQTQGLLGRLPSPSETGYLRREHPRQGDPPGSPHFWLFLTRLEVILCLFYKKPCLCFWNRSFHSLFDMIPYKLNPEICLFRSLWEAEREVR
jgi:hypothetical protein